MGVATIYGLSHAHHKKHFPEKSYKIKTNYHHCFDQKDWLIYSSFYYYCLSCFLSYWFFAMLAVLLTYLSIEPKKETLHFSFSFYKFALFLQYKVSYFYLTHRWFFLVKLFLTFALPKILNTQPVNWLHQANFTSKMPTFFQLFCFNQLP